MSTLGAVTSPNLWSRYTISSC